MTGHRSELESDSERYSSDATGQYDYSESVAGNTALHVCSFTGCDKSFKKRWRLLDHLLTHGGDKAYKCGTEGCGKAYTSKTHLKRHIITAHVQAQSKPCDTFKCDVKDCGKTYSSRAALKKHTDRSHCSTPRYACTVDGCGESFMKGFQLRHHQYSHQGTLAFQCPVDGCHKKFDQSSHLTRHMKIHDGYTCTVSECQQKFSTWSLLRKHTAESHKKLNKTHELAMELDKDSSLFSQSSNYTETPVSSGSSNIRSIFQRLKAAANTTLDRTGTSSESLSRTSVTSFQSPVVECPSSARKQIICDADLNTKNENDEKLTNEKLNCVSKFQNQTVKISVQSCTEKFLHADNTTECSNDFVKDRTENYQSDSGEDTVNDSHSSSEEETSPCLSPSNESEEFRSPPNKKSRRDDGVYSSVNTVSALNSSSNSSFEADNSIDSTCKIAVVRQNIPRISTLSIKRRIACISSVPLSKDTNMQTDVNIVNSGNVKSSLSSSHLVKSNEKSCRVSVNSLYANPMCNARRDAGERLPCVLLPQVVLHDIGRILEDEHSRKSPAIENQESENTTKEKKAQLRGNDTKENRNSDVDRCRTSSSSYQKNMKCIENSDVKETCYDSDVEPDSDISFPSGSQAISGKMDENITNKCSEKFNDSVEDFSDRQFSATRRCRSDFGEDNIKIDRKITDRNVIKSASSHAIGSNSKTKTVTKLSLSKARCNSSEDDLYSASECSITSRKIQTIPQSINPIQTLPQSVNPSSSGSWFSVFENNSDDETSRCIKNVIRDLTDTPELCDSNDLSNKDIDAVSVKTVNEPHVNSGSVTTKQSSVVNADEFSYQNNVNFEFGRSTIIEESDCVSHSQEVLAEDQDRWKVPTNTRFSKVPQHRNLSSANKDVEVIDLNVNVQQAADNYESYPKSFSKDKLVKSNSNNKSNPTVNGLKPYENLFRNITEGQMKKPAESLNHFQEASGIIVNKSLAKIKNDLVEDSMSEKVQGQNKRKIDMNESCTFLACLPVSKGTLEDPILLDEIPQTRRSGRKQIPTLAWWANQRVTVHPLTDEMTIVNGRPNALICRAKHYNADTTLGPESGDHGSSDSETDSQQLNEKQTNKKNKVNVSNDSKKVNTTDDFHSSTRNKSKLRKSVRTRSDNTVKGSSTSTTASEEDSGCSVVELNVKKKSKTEEKSKTEAKGDCNSLNKSRNLISNSKSRSDENSKTEKEQVKKNRSNSSAVESATLIPEATSLLRAVDKEDFPKSVKSMAIVKPRCLFDNLSIKCRNDTSCNSFDEGRIKNSNKNRKTVQRNDSILDNSGDASSMLHRSAETARGVLESTSSNNKSNSVMHTNIESYRSTDSLIETSITSTSKGRILQNCSNLDLSQTKDTVNNFCPDLLISSNAELGRGGGVRTRPGRVAAPDLFPRLGESGDNSGIQTFSSLQKKSLQGTNRSTSPAVVVQTESRRQDLKSKSNEDEGMELRCRKNTSSCSPTRRRSSNRSPEKNNSVENVNNIKVTSKIDNKKVVNNKNMKEKDCDTSSCEANVSNHYKHVMISKTFSKFDTNKNETINSKRDIEHLKNADLRKKYLDIRENKERCNKNEISLLQMDEEEWPCKECHNAALHSQSCSRASKVSVRNKPVISSFANISKIPDNYQAANTESGRIDTNTASRDIDTLSENTKNKNKDSSSGILNRNVKNVDIDASILSRTAKGKDNCDNILKKSSGNISLQNRRFEYREESRQRSKNSNVCPAERRLDTDSSKGGEQRAMQDSEEESSDVSYNLLSPLSN